MFETIGSHTIYTAGLRAQPVVLDLGAHRAEFAGDVRARFGATCHLVEANPALAEALRVTGRFPVLERAVADREGTIPFNIARNDTGSSVLTLQAENKWDLVLAERIEVRATTLESLIAEIGVSRIDILKMDIEGAEVMALRSLSPATLRTIGQITVEFHSAPVFGFDMARDVEAAIRSMRRNGFVCLDFSDGSRLDVLFVNRAFHGISWIRGGLLEFRQSPPSWLLAIWKHLPAGVRREVRSAASAISK